MNWLRNLFDGGDRPTRSTTAAERDVANGEKLVEDGAAGLDDFVPASEVPPRPRTEVGDVSAYLPTASLPSAPSIMPDWRDGVSGHYVDTTTGQNTDPEGNPLPPADAVRLPPDLLEQRQEEPEPVPVNSHYGE
jgi:hypothetical protein